MSVKWPRPRASIRCWPRTRLDAKLLAWRLGGSRPMAGDDREDGMSKKSSSERRRARANTQAMEAVEPSAESRDLGSDIALCHRILRIATAAILGAFVLIIATTTISTGPTVRFIAQALYYVILASALASVTVWMVRVRLEKRMPGDADRTRSSQAGS